MLLVKRFFKRPKIDAGCTFVRPFFHLYGRSEEMMIYISSVRKKIRFQPLLGSLTCVKQPSDLARQKCSSKFPLRGCLIDFCLDNLTMQLRDKCVTNHCNPLYWYRRPAAGRLTSVGWRKFSGTVLHAYRKAFRSKHNSFMFWIDLDWNQSGPRRRPLHNCFINAVRLSNWAIY